MRLLPQTARSTMIMTCAFVFNICCSFAEALIPSKLRTQTFLPTISRQEQKGQTTGCRRWNAAWINSRPMTTETTRTTATTSRLLSFLSYSIRDNDWDSRNKTGFVGEIDAAMKEEQKLEKQELIGKFLEGYNAQSASLLDNAEIERQTLFWSKESGVVGQYFGDELYDDVLGLSISRATTMTDCFGDIWEFINNIIFEFKVDELETETPRRHRWLLRRLKSDRPLKGKSLVYYCIFPQCQELYDYKTFTALVAALEFCKDVCVHLGKEFSVNLFHPKFKDSPAMLSPERHSPFPTIAFQFGPAFQQSEQELPTSIFERKQRKISPPAKKDHEQVSSMPSTTEANSNTDDNEETDDASSSSEPPDEMDEELTNLVEGELINLNEARAHFEQLYNTAAASGLFDSVWTHYDLGDDPEESGVNQPCANKKEMQYAILPPSQPFVDARQQNSGLWSANNSAQDFTSWIGDIDEQLWIEGRDPLAVSFMEECKRRRRQIPASRIQMYINDWAQTAKYDAQGKPNPALLYWDTILPDTTEDGQPTGFVVCNEKVAEHVYAAIWNVIRELYQVGQQADHTATADTHKNHFPPEKPIDPQPSSASKISARGFNSADWLSTLSASRNDKVTDKVVESAQVSSENNGADDNNNNTNISTISSREIRSRVFVANKFMPFNAQEFKNFAITVNAALKRFTRKHMFIEVFHPEYVGNKGFQHNLRRSPFPMILICYHVKPSNKQQP